MLDHIFHQRPLLVDVMGSRYDSDHPRVSGDVGMAGVAIDSVADMEVLWDEIPLDSVSLVASATGVCIPFALGVCIHSH